MKITNPTDTRLEVQIHGVKYVLEPRASVSRVEATVAKYWQENLHAFLIVSEDDDAEDTVKTPEAEKIEEVKESEEEITDETPEDETEEEEEEGVEEKPKTRKRTTKKDK